MSKAINTAAMVCHTFFSCTASVLKSFYL